MSRTVSVEEVRHMAKLFQTRNRQQGRRIVQAPVWRHSEHMGIFFPKSILSNIEPLYTPATQDEFTRADVANNTRQREQILANAPD